MANKKNWMGILAIVLVFGMTAVGCDDGNTDEVTWNNHRYKRIDQSKTWTDAKSYCETSGGHLVTITSPGEQAAVFKLIADGEKNIYWIGGQRIGTSNDFQWVTGEQWDYTNWAAGEPNNDIGGTDANINGLEDCVQIFRIDNPGHANKGEWNDLPDTGYIDFYSLNKIGFVCEWDN
jgi:hypothetical protein